MTAIGNVPYSQLVPAPDWINSRKTAKDVDIDGLAASIEMLGLLQPLLVKEVKPGEEYMIVDGHRRWQALGKTKEIDDALTVPVHVIKADNKTDAAMSLAANIMREDIHEIDKYEAFVQLQSEGIPTDTIAKTFNVPDRYVLQCLALGSAIPEVREAYRSGEINQHLFKLFAEHTPQFQAEIWEKGQKEEWYAYQFTEHLRHNDGVLSTSPITDWVLDDDYLAAGGTIATSLFSDTVRYDDEQLLKKLAYEKLEAKTEEWLAKGWQFVEIEDDNNKFYNNYHPIEQADEESYDWTDEEKAQSGIVICNWVVRKGMARRKTAKPTVGHDEEPEDKPMYSHKLVDDLNTTLTQAVRLGVQRDSDYALALVINTMIESLMCGWSSPISLNFRYDTTHAGCPSEAEAKAVLKAHKLDKLKDQTKRILHILELEPDAQRQVLAALVGVTVTQCSVKGTIPSMIKWDIHETFKADEVFFSRLTKPALIEALAEMDVKVNTDNKKGELVAMCVKHAGLWVPEPVRRKGK